MANAATTGWDAGYTAIRDNKEVEELRKRLAAIEVRVIGRTGQRPKPPWGDEQERQARQRDAEISDLRDLVVEALGEQASAERLTDETVHQGGEILP